MAYQKSTLLAKIDGTTPDDFFGGTVQTGLTIPPFSLSGTPISLSIFPTTFPTAPSTLLRPPPFCTFSDLFEPPRKDHQTNNINHLKRNTISSRIQNPSFPYIDPPCEKLLPPLWKRSPPAVENPGTFQKDAISNLF